MKQRHLTILALVIFLLPRVGLAQSGSSFFLFNSAGFSPDPQIRIDSGFKNTPGDPIRYDLAYEIPINLGLLVANGGVYLGKDALTSDTPKWGTTGFDDFFRDALKWENRENATQWGNAYSVGYWLSRGIGFLYFHAKHGGVNPFTNPAFSSNLTIVSEAVLIDMLINQLTKFATARARPYTQDMSDAELSVANLDRNRSFFSLRTSTAFASFTPFGIILAKRYHYSPKRLAIFYASSILMSGVSAYFKIAGDEHHATDLLAGAAAGALIGTTVGWLHVNPTTSTYLSKLSIVPTVDPITKTFGIGMTF